MASSTTDRGAQRGTRAASKSVTAQLRQKATPVWEIRDWIHHSSDESASFSSSSSLVAASEVASISATPRTIASTATSSPAGPPSLLWPPVRPIISSTPLHTPRRLSFTAARLSRVPPLTTHPTPSSSQTPDTPSTERMKLASDFHHKLWASTAKSSSDSLAKGFVKVIHANALEFLPTASLFRAAYLIPGISDPESISWKTEDATVIEARDLLRSVIAVLGSRDRKKPGGLTPTQRSEFQSLRVHLCALEGAQYGHLSWQRELIGAEMHEVKAVFGDKDAKPKERNSAYAAGLTAKTLRASTQVVKGCGRARDPKGAVQTVVMTWVPLRPHIVQWSRGSLTQEVRQAGDVLRESLFDILVHNVPDAGTWYAELVSTAKYTPTTNRVIGDLLIECFYRRELPHQAFAVYETMLRHGMHVAEFLHSILLRSLTDHHIWPQAAAVHAAFRTQMQERLDNPLFLNSSMRYFSHLGDVGGVEDVYAEIVRLKLPIEARHQSWRMQAHAAVGDLVTVQKLWASYFPLPSSSNPTPREPMSMHFGALLTAFANVGDAGGARNCIDLMRQRGQTPTTKHFNVAIHAFVKRNNDVAVHEILKDMQEDGVKMNESTYIHLIDMYGRLRNVMAAEKMFHSALNAGLPLSQRLVFEVMRAHVDCRSWKGVIRLFDFASSTAVGNPTWLDIRVSNMLLRAHVLIGSPHATVSDVIQDIRGFGLEPNEKTYLFAIQSACDAGAMQLGLDYLQQIEDRPKKTRSVEAFALTLLMGAYLARNMREEARSMYSIMQDRDIVPDSVSFGVIVRAFGNERTAEGVALAEAFLAQLTDGATTDSGSIETSGQGNAVAGQKVFQPVLAAGVRRLNIPTVERHFNALLKMAKGQPSIHVLRPLIDAYRRVGDIEGMESIWNIIFNLALEKTRSRIDDPPSASTPSNDARTVPYDSRLLRNHILRVPLSVYLLGLSAAGKADRVAKVRAQLESLGFGFDAHDWNHLVTELARAGDPIRALAIMESVILPSQQEAQESHEERDTAPATPTSFVEAFSPSETLTGTDASSASTSVGVGADPAEGDSTTKERVD